MKADRHNRILIRQKDSPADKSSNPMLDAELTPKSAVNVLFYAVLAFFILLNQGGTHY